MEGETFWQKMIESAKRREAPKARLHFMQAALKDKLSRTNSKHIACRGRQLVNALVAN